MKATNITLTQRELVTLLLGLKALQIAQSSGAPLPAPPDGIPAAFEGASLETLLDRVVAAFAETTQ